MSTMETKGQMEAQYQQQPPQQQQPSQQMGSSVDKLQMDLNRTLNQHLKPDLQKKTFGVQPAAINTHGSTWANTLFSCFAPPELCLMGWCCPCFLFGRTQSRMKGVRDPDLFNVNIDCAAWCGLYMCGGWQCLYQTVKRIDTRDRLGIEGSAIEDCLTSWCCSCCGLVQEEKESLLKQEAIDAKLQQYQAPAGMTYP